MLSGASALGYNALRFDLSFDRAIFYVMGFLSAVTLGNIARLVLYAACIRILLLML